MLWNNAGPKDPGFCRRHGWGRLARRGSPVIIAQPTSITTTNSTLTSTSPNSSRSVQKQDQPKVNIVISPGQRNNSFMAIGPWAPTHEDFNGVGLNHVAAFLPKQ
jgi:hypothetical protein